jgi:pilus assembly protein CpaB
MRNTRAWIMIALSLVAGIMAIVFAARWLTQQSSMATRKVAVAAANLDLGQQIRPEHVKVIDWPGGSVPAGAFGDAAELKDRVAKIGFSRDEPILESKLAPSGTKGGLSAVIAGGKRAITVRVNDVVGVAGFALPGNYVDVIVNTKDDRKPKEDQAISKIVLEKILVLAVGEEASRDETKPKVVKAVTLEVTPEQAEAIDLARSVGQLSLVLRNQVDATDVKTAGITKDVLLGIEPLPPPKPVIAEKPAPHKHAARKSSGEAGPVRNCVEIFMGSQRSEQCF